MIGCGGVIMVTGGAIWSFASWLSLMVILIPLLAVLTKTNSFKIFYGGMKAAILPNRKLPECSCKQAILVFRLLSKTTRIASLIGLLISLVNALVGLDYYSPESVYFLGTNIASALTTPLYGLIMIAAIFEPVGFILKKQLNSRDNK